MVFGNTKDPRVCCFACVPIDNVDSKTSTDRCGNAGAIAPTLQEQEVPLLLRSETKFSFSVTRYCERMCISVAQSRAVRIFLRTPLCFHKPHRRFVSAHDRVLVGVAPTDEMRLLP